MIFMCFNTIYFVKKFDIMVYNPIGGSVPHAVRVPVPTNDLTVTSDTGKKMKVQVSGLNFNK